MAEWCFACLWFFNLQIPLAMLDVLISLPHFCHLFLQAQYLLGQQIMSLAHPCIALFLIQESHLLPLRRIQFTGPTWGVRMLPQSFHMDGGSSPCSVFQPPLFYCWCLKTCTPSQAEFLLFVPQWVALRGVLPAPSVLFLIVPVQPE